ncbi:LOW QUALITY PROTEIN: hypothetical protein PFAG_03389 [Plasmodium falciparum Santa Lucia]|uniref:Uncharacterized protein n=2 Tax=Plasmodium falciparum TaxID=5833 RepID=A0A024X526_PLAFC|nr:LOW QUALITY PROTEIN: hypothetical protein PFMC_03347 [Plasmodium falciparum CAMP/Malaysia]EUT83514.1 LOW QUALITY PROTEIN: hypothetical protein PFAG_03389 [Plasmodium falciparum Santa Lucia]
MKQYINMKYFISNFKAYYILCVNKDTRGKIREPKKLGTYKEKMHIKEFVCNVFKSILCRIKKHLNINLRSRKKVYIK